VSVDSLGKSNPSDQELAKQAQNGDLTAFNLLVERYQALLFNISYRLVGDYETAGDVTQEAFIRAFRRVRQYRGGSMRAWLARIATNCAYDSLRSRKRVAAVGLDDLVDEDRSAWLVNGSRSPEERVLAIELSEAVNKAVQQLPSDQAAVLVLIDLNGFSYEEASEALGVSLGTVKSRLSRGRAKVRDFFRSCPELLPSGIRLNNNS